MRMTSVVCNVPVLSQNDSTYHHSVFTTWKWHPFATWTPSFIIIFWGHHPPLRRTVFACLQNCYNSCISCSRSVLRYDSINSNLMHYSWTNGRLAIPAPAGLLVVSPGDAPGAITLNVVWTEREFDAYKFSRCMCPSNYNRLWDRAR